MYSMFGFKVIQVSGLIINSECRHTRIHLGLLISCALVQGLHYFTMLHKLINKAMNYSWRQLSDEEH